MPSVVATEPNSIEVFIDKTCLIPAVVLDGVIGEVCQYLKEDPQTEMIYAALRSDSTLESIETKTAHAFASSAGFKKAVSREDPRPGYYSFMRHWVAAELKTHFPAQYQKLPSSFSVGQPL